MQKFEQKFGSLIM